LVRIAVQFKIPLILNTETTTMNPFSQRYQAYSAAALLDILDHPSDYTPEALAAAQAELQGRNLSEQALADAREDNLAILQARQLQRAPAAMAAKQVESTLGKLFDTLNPIHATAPMAEKWARWLSIVFVLMAIATWYQHFRFMMDMFAWGFSEWDFSMVEYAFPLLLLPAGAILFAWRKREGWHLMAAFLVYSTLQAAGLVILAWSWEPFGMTALDELFPQPSLWMYVLITLFFGSLLWAVARPPIRDRFSVTPKAAITTITAFGVLAAMMVAGRLFT
jgi:hypothetical protein